MGNPDEVRSVEDSEEVRWETRVSVFSNPAILKGLGMALGIPFGFLIIVLTIATGGEFIWSGGVLYAFALLGFVLALSGLVMLILFGGKYDMGFVIDRRGVLSYTPKRQARINRAVNTTLIVGGMLTGKPGAAGMGLLAQSRQSMYVAWDRVRRIRVYQRARTIAIKGGFAENVAVFCTQENFVAVERLIRERATAAR